MSRVLWELGEEIVSNSKKLKKLLEDALLLYLYSCTQCVEQMILESGAVCDYSVCLFKSSKARL